MRIRIFSSGGNIWGIQQDSRLIKGTLSFLGTQMNLSNVQIDVCDPVMWGLQASHADIHIYLEIPCRLAMPWAKYNAVVVNQDWWPLSSWNWCFEQPEEGGMNLFIFKTHAAASLFPEVRRKLIIPWRSDTDIVHTGWEEREDRFLYMVGASKNKFLAAKILVCAWKPEWPTLEIWCPSLIENELCAQIEGVHQNIEFQTQYKTTEEKTERQRECKWHVVMSAAEGYGFTMAEAAACGAPMLWCDLPSQVESWDLENMQIGRIPTFIVSEDVLRYPENEEIVPMRDKKRLFDPASIEKAVQSILTSKVHIVHGIQVHFYNKILNARKEFRQGWQRMIHLYHQYTKLPQQITRQGKMNEPLPQGPPKVAVLTITRNRRKWWLNMFQNISSTTWPISRLEWIVVEDGYDEESIEPYIRKIQIERPALTVQYVRCAEGTTIGTKRNIAVQNASSDTQLFVCMDDDDHYPSSSIQQRIQWIRDPSASFAVYCASILMYDVPRYISAVNVPPLHLSPAERVSEATLAFTRTFWNERSFPDTSVGEGDSFLKDREKDTIEIPPTGVIVSFLHKGNLTTRKVPTKLDPNGCHYGFPDSFFQYLYAIGAE
jgi:hypothetical protein